MLALVVGCAPSMQGQSLDVFKVDELPYKRARFILAGLEIDADLKRQDLNGEFMFLPIVYGQENGMEAEKYRKDASGLHLVMAGGESYVPPILIAGPRISVDSTWDWKGETVLSVDGKLLEGPNSRLPASAKVKLGAEPLNAAGGPYDTIKVDVALAIDDGSPSPSKRKLIFWLAPGRGIIKRDFAFSSTRVPAPMEKP